MRAILIAAVCVFAVGCRKDSPATEPVVEPKPVVVAKGKEPPAPNVEAPPKETPKEKVTVEQYRKMCIGKTKEQVKEVLGKPDNALSLQSGKALWTYREIAWNTESEKIVGLRIDFDSDGVCFGVN